MGNPFAEIHDYEVSKLVNRLITFLGRREVENCLRRYQTSLTSSGPVFRDYYIKTRHPWWEALTQYYDLERQGKSILKHLTEELKILAGDAKKVSIIQQIMPDSVRRKYIRDLTDDNRAYDYLFELHVAWHFFLKGYDIQWHENAATPHSEFLIQSPQLEFNVECKRVSVDAFKRIRRKDFYRLAERIIPYIEGKGYSGSIDINLSDRLHADDKSINNLCDQVISQINERNLKGIIYIPSGSYTVDLDVATGAIANLYDRFNKLWERKPHNAHGAIFAKSQKGKPIDPIEMILKSERSDSVLRGIGDKLSKAAETQLSVQKPGLLCCYLEGIYDLRELAKDSGLQIMTSVLLNRDDFNHIAAIVYSSEVLKDRKMDAETFFNQGLIFSNPKCKYEKARDFEFLSKME